MKTWFKTTALTAAAATMAVPVVPAAAVDLPAYRSHAAAPAAEVQANHRDRDRYRDRYDRRYRDGRSYGRQRVYYGEPVYRSTRVWRGRDGNYYCRKRDGTTGLLIGAAVGGLIGSGVAGRRDQTLGVVLGAVAGAAIGRSIDRSNARCR